MITPSSDEIVKLAEKYTTIPVCREIYADMITPIALLRRLQTRSDRFFLLESVEGGEKWARYSFLGYDPILRATCKNGTVTLEGAENRTVETDKPLSVLREVLSRYRAPPAPVYGRLRRLLRVCDARLCRTDAQDQARRMGRLRSDAV